MRGIAKFPARTISLALASILALVPCVAWAQSSTAPAAATSSGAQKDAGSGSGPLYRVTVVAKTTKAINYSRAKGSTPVDFKGTVLMPFAKGEAHVEGKKGVVSISAKFEKMTPATMYGPDFLTYVLWAVTPEGRASNLGELEVDGTKAKVDGAAAFQAFALIVTAEPYFAVTQPSDVVVMENEVRPDTIGSVEEVDAKLDLLQRGDAAATITTGDTSTRLDPRVPLSLYEARNAVRMAQAAGAEKYAGPSFLKAQQQLESAEEEQKHKAARKEVDIAAREAVQTAQDARSITLKRLDEERQQAEQRAAEAREALAKQQAADAEKAKLEAQLAQEKAARERAEAEAARAAALAQQQEAEKAALKAAQDKVAAEAAAAQTSAQAAEAARLAAQQKAAAEADAERARQAAASAEAERAELRKQLLAQLNSILQTRDSARGLIVNMSDVLFDTGSYTLKPGAREKLAKISGILLAYPSLKVQVEGHTDSVGGDDYNQRLSERRAGSVREYLVSQQVSSESVSAFGFGKTRPVATNDTPEGRQQNRRVELVVSGAAIGENQGGVPVGGETQEQ
jgi:outer membrane protein OmpA-like peptidoglycan-associated protein